MAKTIVSSGLRLGWTDIDPGHVPDAAGSVERAVRQVASEMESDWELTILVKARRVQESGLGAVAAGDEGGQIGVVANPNVITTGPVSEIAPPTRWVPSILSRGL